MVVCHLMIQLLTHHTNILTPLNALPTLQVSFGKVSLSNHRVLTETKKPKQKLRSAIATCIKQRLMICNLICQNHSAEQWNWLVTRVVPPLFQFQNMFFSLKSSLVFVITSIYDIAGHSPISHQHAPVVRSSPLTMHKFASSLASST